MKMAIMIDDDDDDDYKADYENFDPEKPNTSLFCEDGDYDTSLYTVDY